MLLSGESLHAILNHPERGRKRGRERGREREQERDTA